MNPNNLRLFSNFQLLLFGFLFSNSLLLCQPESTQVEVKQEVEFKEMTFDRIFANLDTFLSQEIKEKFEKQISPEVKIRSKNYEEDINKTINSIREGHQSLYQIMSKASGQFWQGDFAVKLEEESFRHLRILSGDQGVPGKNIWTKLDRTATCFGRPVLAQMLSTPTTNLGLLRARQAFLKNLIENQNVFKQFNDQLSKIKPVQGCLLEILATDPSKDFENILHPSAMFDWNTSNKSLLVKSLTLLNKNLIANNVAVGLQSVFRLIMYYSTFVNGYGFVRWISDPAQRRRLFSDKNDQFIRDLNSFKGKNTFDPEIASDLQRAFNSHFMHYYQNVIFPPFSVYFAYDNARGWAVSIEKSFKQSGAMREVLKAYAQSQKLVQSLDPEQRSALNLFDKSAKELRLKINRNLNWLIKNLPKTKSPGGFIIAYKLIYELRANMAYIFAALGQLDAFLSMAKFYQEVGAKKNGLCFAQFSESENPVIVAIDAWDLSLDPDVAVPSNFEFGGGGLSHNVMLTGPNTGGKSTFMRSIFLNILLAQTFGLGCGKSLVLTPMHGIFSYMNVVDNISKGMSQFYSEAFMVKEGLERVKSLAEVGKPSFFMVDEMFSGTNPEDARSILEAICKSAARIDKSIWVISTHLSGAAQAIIDKTAGKFGGMMISTSISPENKVVFDHRVVKGISSVSTAFDVITAVGLDKEIIDDARAIRGQLCH